jgi:hypothetical protein
MKINIRKILNLPNSNQTIVINDGCEKLIKMAEEKTKIHYKYELKSQWYLSKLWLY